VAVKKKKAVKKKVKKKTTSVKKKGASSKKRSSAPKTSKSSKKKATAKKASKKTSKKAPKKPAKKTAKKAVTKNKAKAEAKKAVAKKAVSKKTVAKKAVAIKSIKAPTPKKEKPKKAKPVEPPEEIIQPVVKSPFKDDDPKILKIQEGLIQERKRLMSMLRSSQEVERTINDITFSNEIDLASSLEGREMAFQLSSRERNELRMVEDALFKIRAGTYGVCDSCSKYITLKRLEIMPLSALCIECQENLEVR
jgi:DnaK suppressor protein